MNFNSRSLIRLLSVYQHPGKISILSIDVRTFKSWRSVRTNLADSQQVFEWALYVTRVLLDLHPSTFHNCTLDRVGLVDSLVERHSVQCRAFINPDTDARAGYVVMMRVENIRGTNSKMKATKRSSGYARAEIRMSLRHCVSRIYWFITPRPPRSHRRCRRYRCRRLVVSLNFSSSLRTRN